MTRRCALAVLTAGAAALCLATSAGAAFPGHNGRIAFDRYANGSVDADIVTVKADGSNPIKLTRHSPTADDVQPAYSPNGQRITWARDDDIWVMKADGSGKRRLTHNGVNYGAAFSPTGRKIIWTHIDGQHDYIKVMRADGSRKRFVGVEGLNPAWSPDGRWIAYDRRNDAFEEDIYLAHPNGEGEVDLTALQDGDARHPDWSPDGEKMVYQRQVSGEGFDIFMMDAGGGNPAPIVQGTADQEYPVISPNGARIAFENRASETDFDLWTAAVGPSTPVQITSLPTAYDEFPSWQPR